MLNYDSRKSVWHADREVIANSSIAMTFAFKWSYAKWLRWSKVLAMIGRLSKPPSALKSWSRYFTHTKPASKTRRAALFRQRTWTPPPITLTCKSGDSLDHLADASVDCVVMDPPYYDNVMYAELSDFFYVWLKRTAGQVFPELFRRPLTDKENEAVANPAKFRDQKGAKALAGRDYQERMAAIFAECRRVLKPDGIMTLMFTHKATGAWDALTKGLMQAGFTITASWPINTEAEGSLHIKDKAAANSTIFLACRPRATVAERCGDAVLGRRGAAGRAGGPQAGDGVSGGRHPRRGFVSRLLRPGAGGVFATLAAETRHAEAGAAVAPQSAAELFPEPWDPYAVSPEDALDAARREVKSWRLEQLTHKKAHDRTRSAHVMVRAGMGCVPGTRLPLRRSVASRPRRRR